MIIRVILAALALLLVPTTAQACTASGPDGFVTGLVWDNKPSELPEGAHVVRIENLRPMQGSWIFTAEVTEGPKAMIGRRYRFMALNNNTCVGFGSRSGYAAVAAEKGSIPVDAEVAEVLQLIDYTPTIYNEVVRFLFGGSQWRYPGEPSEKQSPLF